MTHLYLFLTELRLEWVTASITGIDHPVVLTLSMGLQKSHALPNFST